MRLLSNACMENCPLVRFDDRTVSSVSIAKIDGEPDMTDWETMESLQFRSVTAGPSDLTSDL